MPNTVATINSISNFNIKNRSLINKRWKFNDPEYSNLEEIRDMFRKQRDLQKPHDLVTDFSRAKVEFTSNGVPTLRFVKTSGDLSERCIFSKRGWDSFMTFIAPGGLRDWEALASLDEIGTKISEMALNKLVQNRAGFEALFRTQLTKVKTGDGDVVVRMIRTVQSGSANGYTTLDNLSMLEQLLLDQRFAESRVLQLSQEDERFSLRLSMTKDEDVLELGKQYPTLSVLNSEVGLGSINIVSGTMRPSCLNGLYSTLDESSIRFVHRGNRDRIIDAIHSNYTNFVSASQRVVDLYNRSLEVEVNDIHRLMELEFANLKSSQKLTEAEQDLIYESLSDETTSDNSTLASMIDAMTFAAKSLPLDRQAGLETLSFELLEKSLRKAVNNKILLEV